MSLSLDMAMALRAPRRNLCFLARIETAGADLTCWSGLGPLSWDGATWVGVGHLYGMSGVGRGSLTEWRPLSLTLNGLPGEALAGLDESVRGRGGRLWLGALNASGQVIRDPLRLMDFEQDVLRRELGSDGTVTLTLDVFEALPRFDKSTGLKWSHDAALARWGDDEGFYYNTQVARAGARVDWRPPA